MDQPLLTVIVPCYNVESYIERCILSIVNQTYINLEILLINDGSTDETGDICNAWQKIDPRIKVIHQQNEGSSFARKAGVENASAEYITFVDADDWIDRDMYENMMSALLSTNSDIAQCDFCHAYEDGGIEDTKFHHNDASIEIVERIKGVLLILESNKWQSYMWNKIFKKHLFNHIEFPKGRRISEDTTIMHILFHHAKQTVYLQAKYYNYLLRYGSLTDKTDNMVLKMKNLDDTYKAFYERYGFVSQHPEYHDCLLLIKNNVFCRGMRLFRYSIIYPQYFPPNYSNLLHKQLNSIQFARKDIIKELITPLIRIETSVFLKYAACYKGIVMIYAKIRILMK